MKCQSCDKITGQWKKDKVICGACREELKVDLVYQVRGMFPVYLDEHNRYKKGRRSKLTATDRSDIYYAHVCSGQSMGKLAKKYGVGKSTIHRVIQKQSGLQPKK